MYYLVVFLVISLLSVGIILMKKPFFSFAYATSGLLNSMLESNEDENYKQKGLIQNLGKILSKFGILLFYITITIGVSLIPVILYVEFKPASIDELDTSSFYFILSMLLGSVVLFIFPRKNKTKNEDYSDWSKLLHRMILDHYNISRSLFHLERRVYKKKLEKQNDNFVIVTGLARGGTTALTNLLYESKKFHSLSYDNMPFLLSVNLWGIFYHPRKSRLKERAHGDNILFGYDTIEALEEYFFKAFLKDKFITTSTLEKHDINQRIYESYLAYQNLVRKKDTDSTYLAKNNNLILRYRSLRKYNPGFKIILIFRSPEAHAFSLLNQHKRFAKMQGKDPFALEYMNWLGHHEFGLNHKVFDLNLMDLREKYESTSINYWIAVWISYYTYILTLVDDKHLFLIDYSDLCSRPNELLSTMGNLLNMNLTIRRRDPYDQRHPLDLKVSPELDEKSNLIYQELIKHKVEIQNVI